MRRNDFFKYLLLGGGGSESRSELESEILPYAFNSNLYKLRNYRIYGAEGGVGDSVSSGEHSGEYLVPVTVEGKNLFDEKYDAISSNNITYKAIYIGNNICTLSTDMPLNNILGTNLFLLTGNVSTGASTTTNGVYVNHSKTVASTNGYVTIAYRFYDIKPIDYHVQLEKGSTATAYEPYRTPVTTPIYLPEPIKMVGDEAEYIDFMEQKQHFADGTSQNIKIPALPITAGINTLSIGTTVQPSKIWIQGNISEIETVSIQALQANMQSLQPLSFDDDDLQLDVMPTDKDLQLDVKPIEKPVLNLNNVSEIENAEIERGVENAE